MSTTPLRLGLIGAGPRGIDHIKGALHTGLYRFIAAADLAPERLAKLYEAAKPEHAYDDYKKMLAAHRGQLDVVHLCTQPTLRTPAIRAAAEAGVKALVVEKPMALDYAEAQALERISREAGMLLVVNHQKRGMKEWLALKEAVSSGKLGKVTMLRATCYSNLLGQGTHMFDMAWHILGEPEPKWIVGGCEDRLSLPETHPAPRNALALVEFDGGARGIFCMSEDCPVYPHATNPYVYYNLDVIGTEGRAEVVINMHYRRWDREGRLAEAFPVKWGGENQLNAQATLSSDVARALREPGFKHPQRGESALVSFGLIEAVCRAAQRGTVVTWPIEPAENALAAWSRRKPQAEKKEPAHV